MNRFKAPLSRFKVDFAICTVGTLEIEAKDAEEAREAVVSFRPDRAGLNLFCERINAFRLEPEEVVRVDAVEKVLS